MPVLLRPGGEGGVPDSMPWTPIPGQARGAFPRATELLRDIGGGCWLQWRREQPGALTHLEENQIGLKGEKKKKTENGISAMSKPSFPLVAIESERKDCCILQL